MEEQKKKKRFKTASDLGFCIRNRLLASHPEYKISLFIPFSSISVNDEKISFKLQNTLETSPFLEGEIIFYSNNSLHIFIQEISPLYPRYRIPQNDIFNIKNLSLLTPSEISSSKLQ